MITIPWTLKALLNAVGDAGGVAYLVGGCVRDSLMGLPPEDFDVEVFGLEPRRLEGVLARYGRVNLVGESFGVYKVRLEIVYNSESGKISGIKVGEVAYDFSIPRREAKTGQGHRDFEIAVDPGLTPRQASARRDFSINSIMYCPVTHQYLDHHGGVEDIGRKALRPTSGQFADDPLRILRGMQFAGRFDMTPDAGLIRIGHDLGDQYGTLPVERVWGEWYKWATLSQRPAAGLRYLEDVGWLRQYPTLEAIRGLPQDPTWHPEGDVLAHTRHACDAAARVADRDGLRGDDRAVLLLAALLHDAGKATTTVEEEGRWRSPGHAEAGVPIAESFLDSIGCPQWIKEHVTPLVAEHMFSTREKITHRALRRLMVRLEPVTPVELHRLMEADSSGRPPLPAGPPEGSDQLLRMAAGLPSKIEPILRGRHLLATGRWQPGPAVGVTLRVAFDAQLDGDFEDEDGALTWLHNYINKGDHGLDIGDANASQRHLHRHG